MECIAQKNQCEMLRWHSKMVIVVKKKWQEKYVHTKLKHADHAYFIVATSKTLSTLYHEKQAIVSVSYWMSIYKNQSSLIHLQANKQRLYSDGFHTFDTQPGILSLKAEAALMADASKTVSISTTS